MAKDDLKQKVFTSVKWTSIATIISASTQFIQVFILSYLLSPRDFGLMAIVNIVINFIRSFSDLGISSAIIHKQDIDSNQITNLFWLNFGVAVMLFLVSISLSPILAYVYNENELINLIIVISISLLFAPIGSLHGVLLQKELEFNKLAYAEIFSVILGFIVTIGFAIKGFAVWSLVIGQLTNVLVKATFYFYYAAKCLTLFPIQRGIKIREYLVFGSFQIGERMVNFLAERIDQIVIGSLLGMTQLGYYNFAFNLISQPISIINPVFTRVAFPYFAKIQNNTIALKDSLLKLLKILSTINSPILIIFLLFAPNFIPLIFADRWNDSIILLQILSIVSIFRVLGNPAGSIILAKGKPQIGFKWNLFLFLITIPLIYFTASLGNIIWVGSSLVFLQFFLVYPNYKYMIQPFVGSCFPIYLKTYFIPVFGALLSGLMTLFLYNRWEGYNKVAILVLGISTMMMLFLFFLFITDKKLFTEIKSFVRKR